jgi:hypothetical protein
MSDRERLKLLNKLCKTCSRYRVIPKSMHIPDCSKDSVEVECGGFADVSQSTYKGRRVAVKVVRVYVTSDLDVILSVSLLLALLHLSGRTRCRDSAERELHGSISDIRISCHCLE